MPQKPGLPRQKTSTVATCSEYQPRAVIRPDQRRRGSGGHPGGHPPGIPRPAASDDAPEEKEKAIRVNVGAVVRGDLVESIFADGEIRTPRSLEVKAKIGGQLTDVLVRDGDRITIRFKAKAYCDATVAIENRMMRFATPPVDMKADARMKKGMASRAKLSRPVAIRWA